MSDHDPVDDAVAAMGTMTDIDGVVDVLTLVGGRPARRNEIEVTRRRLVDSSTPLERALAGSALAVATYWDETVATDETSPDGGAVGRDRLTAEALAAASESGDESVVALCRLRRALATWGSLPTQERSALADEVLVAADRLGRRDLEIGARLVRATDRLRTWSLAEFHAEVAAMDRLASDDPSGLAAWLAELWRGTLSLVAGRLDLAESSSRSAYRLARAGPLARVRPESQRIVVQRLLARLTGAETPPGPIDDAVGRDELPPSWALAAAERDARLGRLGPARHRYEQVARTDFASLPRNMTWPTSIVMAVETAIALDDGERFELLGELLDRCGDDVIVIGPGHAVWGAAALYRARVARAAGDRSAAREAAERALAATPTGPFGALAALESGRLGAWPRSAAELAEEFTHYGMLPMAEAVRAVEQHERSHRSLASQSNAGFGLDLAGRTASFRLGERTVTVRATVGVAHLAELLRRPGQEVHALELVAPGAPPDGPGDDVADREAVASFRRRLLDLDDELRHTSDPVRVEQLQDEFDRLTDHLGEILGLTGPRRMTSNAERARSAATKAIRRAIAMILDVDGELGRHLDASVRTGTFCSYEPDDGRRWVVTGPSAG